MIMIRMKTTMMIMMAIMPNWTADEDNASMIYRVSKSSPWSARYGNIRQNRTEIWPMLAPYLITQNNTDDILGIYDSVLSKEELVYELQ